MTWQASRTDRSGAGTAAHRCRRRRDRGRARPFCDATCRSRARRARAGSGRTRCSVRAGIARCAATSTGTWYDNVGRVAAHSCTVHRDLAGELLRAAGMSGRRRLDRWLPATVAAGYRRYTRTDINALIFTRRARALGLRVDDIAVILACRRDGRPPCDTTRALLDQRIGEIDATLANLTALRAALARDRANQVRPDDDDHDAGLPTGPGYVCPLIEQASQ